MGSAIILKVFIIPLPKGVVWAMGFNVCCLLLNWAILSSPLRWSMTFKIKVALVVLPSGSSILSSSIWEHGRTNNLAGLDVSKNVFLAVKPSS